MTFEVMPGYRTRIRDRFLEGFLQTLREISIITECVIKDTCKILEHERSFIFLGVGGGDR